MKSDLHEDPIDEQIKRAQEEGLFDQLSGKGRPFSHLDTDPLNNVLQAQGFASRWIELDEEIRQKRVIAEQAVKRTYEWVMQSRAGGGVDRSFAQDEWRKARRILGERLAEINQLIKLYNLQVPPQIGQKFLLKEDSLLAELLGPDYEKLISD